MNTRKEMVKFESFYFKIIKKKHCMQALIPLLLIFILFNSHQLKTDNLYRANIFALVGISYFFLFQYTIYWYQIFPTDSLLQLVPGLLIMITTVLIALSRWNKKSDPIKTLFLCSLCAAALVWTLGFDRSIKEYIAEIGGYFANEPITSYDPATKENLRTKSVDIEAIGLQMDVSIQWKEHALPSGHIYFTAENNGQLMLEARPNCIKKIQKDTPTFVHNTLQLFEAFGQTADYTVKCVNNTYKECLLTVKYAHPTGVSEKWRWFRISPDQTYAMMMDFLIFAQDPAIPDNILHLITSAKHKVGGPNEHCHTPGAWL